MNLDESVLVTEEMITNLRIVLKEQRLKLWCDVLLGSKLDDAGIQRADLALLEFDKRFVAATPSMPVSDAGAHPSTPSNP